MTSATLILDINTYWHPGTGRGAGTALDAVTHRDSRGLPGLPGRTVKGLLRDVVRQAGALRWYAEDSETIEARLFGWRTRADARRPDDIPLRGCLHFSDASLAPPVASYLARNPDLLPGLYRSHFTTRIDPATGTALDKSLRGQEVIVPLTLQAEITEISGQSPPDSWPQLLDLALPLLRSLGESRTRGFGRVGAARIVESQEGR